MSIDTGHRSRQARRFLNFRFLWKAGLAVLVAAAIVWALSGGKEVETSTTTFAVRRGALPITIVEGGSAESQDPQRIKCEVKGQVKILSLVEEGYRITEEDIKQEKLLIELDSSDLEDRIMTQEIEYQVALAALSKAKQDYEIQQEQNEADIKTAERDAKFKGMDLQKYLGEGIADELIALTQKRRAAEIASKTAMEAVRQKGEALRKLEEAKAAFAKAKEEAAKAKEKEKEEKQEAAEPGAMAAEQMPTETDQDGGSGAPQSVGDGPASPDQEAEKRDEPSVEELEEAVQGAVRALEEAKKKEGDAAAQYVEASKSADNLALPEDETEPASFPVEFEPIDFSSIATDERLGGEAEQKRNAQEAEIILSEEQLIADEKELKGTEKLFRHDFVTEVELDRDRMKVKRAKIDLESKRTSKRLFFRYEFPKKAEELVAQYEEALRKLDRTKREAQTKLTNAKVGLDAAQARYDVQTKVRKDYQQQLEKCRIVAEHEGLVVYGDGRDRWWEDPIREGSTVYEQMTLLTIPDITEMAIEVEVHESAVKKVKKGQEAKITVEAFPDEELTGKVTKVSVLPSSQSRWLNPDLKVYETTVSIEGVHDWLKPGMTAEVEIMIEELDDVLYVPIQAVGTRGGERVCYLANGETRVVETGEMSDKYIEIKTGLEEGDTVLLRPLEGEGETEDADESEDNQEDAGEEPPSEPQPAPVPPRAKA